MRAAIAAEAMKLWSLPSQRWLLIVAVGLAAVSAVFFYVSLPVTQGRTLAQLGTDEILGAGILGVDAAAFVVIVLAASHVGSEYATGSIQTTLTLTPSRWRTVIGKLFTAGLAGLVVGVVAACICLVAAVIAGAGVGVGAGSILTPGGLQLAAGSVAMPVMYAVIAAAGAFMFRGTALGIVTALAVMAAAGIAGLLGESLGAVVTAVMPVSAIHTLAGSASGAEEIGAAAALASLVVWVAIAAGASTWRLGRTDA